MSQLSLFGAESPATDGLFLALFPEAQARGRIARTAHRLRSRHGLTGALPAPDRYHIRLFDFGEHHGLPPRLVSEAMQAAAAIETLPFDVAFDRALSFSGANERPLVLCGDGGAKLIGLQRAVGVAMQKARLGRATRPLVPHVTLLYDRQGIEEQPVERIGWTVTEFVLVHSMLARGQYVALGRWLLRADGVRLN